MEQRNIKYDLKTWPSLGFTFLNFVHVLSHFQYFFFFFFGTELPRTLLLGCHVWKDSIFFFFNEIQV